MSASTQKRVIFSIGLYLDFVCGFLRGDKYYRFIMQHVLVAFETFTCTIMVCLFQLEGRVYVFS